MGKDCTYVCRWPSIDVYKHGHPSFIVNSVLKEAVCLDRGLQDVAFKVSHRVGIDDIHSCEWLAVETPLQE